jgi:hypothetical protein
MVRNVDFILAHLEWVCLGCNNKNTVNEGACKQFIVTVLEIWKSNIKAPVALVSGEYLLSHRFLFLSGPWHGRRSNELSWVTFIMVMLLWYNNFPKLHFLILPFCWLSFNLWIVGWEGFSDHRA